MTILATDLLATIAPKGYTGSQGGSGTQGVQGVQGASVVSGTTGQVIYNNAGVAAGAAGLFYNSATTRVGVNTTTPGYNLEVNGSFAATTKSFIIEHPTKPDMLLRYGSLEGPENGVYVRGRITQNNVIELPDYWSGLINYDSITVNLTPVGAYQTPYVSKIENNKVYIENSLDCYFIVYAERIDVEKLVVEFKTP